MKYPDWLINFFIKNKIQLHKINEKGYEDPWLSTLNDFLLPIKQKQYYFALPYINFDGKIQIYIVGGESERELLELDGIVKNALSNSYIEHYELVRNSSENEHPKTILLSQFPLGCICLSYFQKLSGGKVLQGFQLINRLIQLLNRRPPIINSIKRPIGRILRDFYLAKENRDFSTLQNCFEEIKTNSALGAQNLILLEIQMLSAQERWKDIVNHTELKYLTDGLMPPGLLRSILNALGNIGANKFLDNSMIETDVIKDLQYYYQRLSPIFKRSLELPKDPNYKQEWQQWIIGTILLGQYKHLEKIPKFIDIEWCGKVLELVKKHGISFNAHENNQKLSLDVPSTIEQARIYLNHCASLPPENWYEIWRYLEKTPLEIRCYINENHKLKERWDLIESYCSEEIIYGWSDWFDGLISDANIDFDQHLFKLNNECQIWSISSFIESQLMKVLQVSKINVKETLLNSLPIILDWIKVNKVVLKNDTILQLFTLISDDDKSDPNDLILFYDLLLYWKKYRINNTYDAQVIMCLDEVAKKSSTNPLYNLPTYLNWLMSIIELLKSFDGIQNKDEILLNNFLCS